MEDEETSGTGTTRPHTDPPRQGPPPPPPPLPEPPSEQPAAAPKPPVEGPPTEKRKRPFWVELPLLVVIAFVVALIIKTFLMQAFYIPSGSMETTLAIGDRVLVEKISYRFHEPRRGDVVVFERGGFGFEAEEDGSFFGDITDSFKGLFGFPTGGNQDFIKRVIAIEGDTVEGREGTVFVNGEEISEPYLDPGVVTSSFGPTEVPDGMMFMMGDNRMNSEDSRSFGAVPVDSVIGHAFVIVWPFSNIGGL